VQNGFRERFLCTYSGNPSYTLAFDGNFWILGLTVDGGKCFNLCYYDVFVLNVSLGFLATPVKL
jgi:hypothetical protein